MPTSDQLMSVIAVQSEIAMLGLDLGGVMALVVERILELVRADGAAIELAEGDHMVYSAASGRAASQLGLRLDVQGSLSGLCVRMGETLCCDDSETDSRVDREACRKVGLRSMIVMPLRHKGIPVGVLKAMSAEPAHFSDGDVAVLGLLSEVVAASMYFATKYDTDDLFFRATHDGLTGLANRSLFMDRLRTAVSQGERDRRIAGLLMIDMDGLKQVNDNFGHRAGDAIIREFADRIRTVARTSDTVARLGGDEFAMVLTPIEPEHGIDAILGRLDKVIEPPFSFEGKVYTLRASIGAALHPEDGAEIGALIDVADQRMYAVKRGRHTRSGRQTA